MVHTKFMWDTSNKLLLLLTIPLFLTLIFVFGIGFYGIYSPLIIDITAVLIGIISFVYYLAKKKDGVYKINSLLTIFFYLILLLLLMNNKTNIGDTLILVPSFSIFNFLSLAYLYWRS